MIQRGTERCLLFGIVRAVAALLLQLLIIAPHERMIVVKLGQKVVHFCGVSRLKGPHHPFLEKFRKGLGLLQRCEQPQASADLIVTHEVSSRSALTADATRRYADTRRTKHRRASPQMQAVLPGALTERRWISGWSSTRLEGGTGRSLPRGARPFPPWWRPWSAH